MAWFVRQWLPTYTRGSSAMSRQSYYQRFVQRKRLICKYPTCFNSARCSGEQMWQWLRWCSACRCHGAEHGHLGAFKVYSLVRSFWGAQLFLDSRQVFDVMLGCVPLWAFRTGVETTFAFRHGRTPVEKMTTIRMQDTQLSCLDLGMLLFFKVTHFRNSVFFSRT